MDSYVNNGYWENRQPESSLFGGMALWAMIVCVINCSLPQVEMLITGGNVPIPQGFIKIACFSFLIILMLMYRTLDLSSFPTTAWVMAVGYLILVFPFLWFSQDKQPGEILFAYNAYYCSLIFAPVAAALRGKVPERLAIRIFLGTFAACALLGWAQFILQKPLVQLASNDGNFRIFASQWMMPGETLIRATSFFGTALEYGNFAVLMAAIGIGMCGEPGGWKKGIPLYLIAAATCYTTWTRVVFLQLFVATVAALTFTFGRKPNRVTWQPLIALGLGWLIAFSGITSLINQEKGLSNSTSLELRLQQWETYGTTMARATVSQQLFGFGFCQADKPVIIPRKDEFYGKAVTVLVDNTYLALMLHIGVIGTLVMMGLLWGMWRHLRMEAANRPTPMLVGIASFWATFLMTGMFNIQAANFGYWYLIGLIVLHRASEAGQETQWVAPLEPGLELG